MDTRYHTSPQLNPLKIELADVRLTKVAVGDMDNNCYIISRGSDVVIVDAAADPRRILETLAAVVPGPPTVHAIVTTHEHADHWQALHTMRAVFNDAELIATKETAAAIGIDAETVKNGEKRTFGSIELEFIILRGHTKAGLAVVIDDPLPHILTGDSLFPGGVGKVPSGQAFFLLLNDVRHRLFDRFPDAVIHPGHGDSTTLATERPHLDEWEERVW